MKIPGAAVTALLVAIVSVRAITPESLHSDLSILIQNDLLESESPLRNSGILLLDEAPLDRAQHGCHSLDESLWGSWGSGRSFAEVQPSLNYLAYQGKHRRGQRYWIAPSHSGTARAIDSRGVITRPPTTEALPVLCTQTAPYSNETHQDTRPQFQVTVSSNNERITGFRDRLSFRFLGIRYAEQPSRWTYSEPYRGSHDASGLHYGSSCLQGPDTGSEDCLFLNIWTPYLPHRPSHTPPSALKPVMFWIHGGAFTGGEGSDPNVDGSNLAARGDVVVVSINYRLGTLGFLALDDGVTNGNFGLADQITALDWVRAHIRDFGGDPDRITIFGQSAGAASVRALLASPRARHKFAGAIMQSNLGGLAYGTTYSHYYTIPEQMRAVGNAILHATNCSDVKCLRALPAETFVSLDAVARFLVVDGVYLDRQELDLHDRDATAAVPVLMGLMRDDGAAMIGYPRPNDTLASFLTSSGVPSTIPESLFPLAPGPNATLDIFNTTARLATDAIFRCIDQATAVAAATTAVFPDVYFYEFNRSYQMAAYDPNPPLCDAPITAASPAGDPSMEYFKCHSGEIFYVFGNLRRQGLPLRDEYDLPFEQFVVDSWASFARSGNPTPDRGLLSVRGYTHTMAEIEHSAPWRPVGSQQTQWTLKRLQWPGAVVPFEEEQQCRALGLGLDYYL